MMRVTCTTLLLLALLASLIFGQDAVATLEPAFPVAETRLVDFDGDGRHEVLVVGRAGELRVHRVSDDGKSFGAASETWSLPDPTHCLLDIHRPGGDKAPAELIVLDGKGARAYTYDRAKGLLKKSRRLARRARFRIRSGRPSFADFVRDVNGDGRVDLVVPEARFVTLWLATEKSFKKTAEVAVKMRISSEFKARGNRDFFEHYVEIPDLTMTDVNGDQRPDLVVTKSNSMRFHLQKPDGSIPVEADRLLDHDKFRDTSAKATVRPGYTLAGTEKAKSLMRDLDADGIPDYLVAHRRKVWIFHGTKDGPQFVKPTGIMKTADEITGIWVARLDDDDDVDLLIVRVQVPSIAGIIGGLLGSVEIDFSAAGYANLDGKRFEKKPSWKRDLTFKLPSISEILRNPDAILKRFEDAGRKFRRNVRADFNGDGRNDVALVTEDAKSLDRFLARSSDEARGGETLDDVLREVLFEDDNDVWDLDRMVAWLGSLGARQVSRLTAGRDPDSRTSLPDPAETPLRRMLAGPLDGRAGDELLLVFSRALREDADLVRIQLR